MPASSLPNSRTVPPGNRTESPGGRLLAPAFAAAVGDGHAAVTAKGAGGDLYAGRSLAALVLGPVPELHGASHVLLLEAGGDDLSDPLVLLYVSLQDRVEDLIRW